MTISVFKRVVAETREEIRKFGKADESKLKTWARVRPEGRRPKFLKAILDRSWNTLAREALIELKARRTDLDEMMLRQERIITLAAKLDIMDAITKTFLPITKRADWPALRIEIKKNLVDRGTSAAEAAKNLTWFEFMDKKSDWPSASAGIEGFTRQLDRLGQSQLAAMMGEVIALAVARFNQHVDTGAAPETDPKIICEQAEIQLAAAELEIWKALKESDLALVWAYATRLSRFAADLLIKHALPHTAALAAKRQGASDFVIDGRLALRYGDLIRSLLRAVALGHTISWFARWPKSAPSTQDWLQAAKNLPFPSKIKPPPLARIAALAARPAASHGKLLTVEGILGPVKIVHRGRKAISSALVSDANGKSVTITIPYIKLDSGGMVPGSYVRVSGTWQKASKEVSGPALLIDRLNFGQLGDKSWSDWATAQLRQIFQPVPHNLAASWSWEPGSDGAGNQLRYGVWAENSERSNQ